MDKNHADTTTDHESDPFHPAGTFSLTNHARQLEDAMNAPKTLIHKPAHLPAKSGKSK